MSAPVTTDLVWQEIGKHLFAVLAVATPRGEPRTVGIVYVVRDRRLYIATERMAWKARHIERNPSVSLTVTIPKRVPFMPWIRIPAATITFQGEATIHDVEDVAPGIRQALLRGLEVDQDTVSRVRIIQVRPTGEFLTYGVGVSLRTMRRPEQSRGRAPV
jgi:uncharacterized pyridoxamine 5'-phosphate oxidase family protein